MIKLEKSSIRNNKKIKNKKMWLGFLMSQGIIISIRYIFLMIVILYKKYLLVNSYSQF